MGNFSNDKFNVTGRFINDLTIMVVNSTIITYEDMNEYCLQVKKLIHMINMKYFREISGVTIQLFCLLEVLLPLLAMVMLYQRQIMVEFYAAFSGKSQRNF